MPSMAPASPGAIASLVAAASDIGLRVCSTYTTLLTR